MDVGLQMIFATYGWSNVSDEQAWDEELRLARLAADLGFDVLWSVGSPCKNDCSCPDIRPPPTRSFDGRVYAVASSDDSVVSAAKLNARLVMFADRPWPMRMPAIQKHRDLVRRMHGEPARPPLLADFCVCTATMDDAEAQARRYMGKFVESNFYHYELLGPHFSTVKGYDAYAQKIAMAREIGMEGIVSAFMEAAVWGTPHRILRTLEERRALVGGFELPPSFRFGGTPLALAESGRRLHAKDGVAGVRSRLTTAR